MEAQLGKEFQALEEEHNDVCEPFVADTSDVPGAYITEAGHGGRAHTKIGELGRVKGGALRF